LESILGTSPQMRSSATRNGRCGSSFGGGVPEAIRKNEETANRKSQYVSVFNVSIRNKR
jgi:hypothetical protein